MRLRRLLALAVPGLCLVLPAGAQNEATAREAAAQRPAEVAAEKDARRVLARGADAQAAGGEKEAREAYGRAAELAREAGSAELEAQAVLKGSELLRPSELPAAELSRVAGDLRRVVETGTPEQREIARNNLGNLYLATGDAASALAVLEAIDLDRADPGSRSVFTYNRSRALEAAGRGEDAFAGYLDAIAGQPSFLEAVEGARRVALGAPGPEQAVRLAGQLVGQGLRGDAAGVLRDSVARWPTAATLTALARYWAEVGTAAAEDAGAGPGILGELPPGTPAEVRALATELTGVFDDDAFSAAGREGGDLHALARQGFPSWRGDEERAAVVATLLSAVARERARQGDAAGALGRTFVAWWVNRADTDAALACARLLRRRPDLDPDGRVFEELVEDVIQSKGRAYRDADWRNILRLHLLLADIYRERCVWGPRSELRSVTFQLEHALVAEAELAAAAGGAPPSPGLHQGLADAYLGRGEGCAAPAEPPGGSRADDLAFRHYSLAAEGFLVHGDRARAERAVRQAAALDPARDPARRRELAALLERVRQLPDGRTIEP